MRALALAARHLATLRHRPRAAPPSPHLFQPVCFSTNDVVYFSRQHSASARAREKQERWHPTAVIARGANVAADARVGPFCVVSSGATVGPECELEARVTVYENASIAASCTIGAGTTVGADVSIGARTSTGYNVALTHCDVGERCVLHHGVAIGQDGFGFHHGPDGDVVKRPQERRVIIGDDVVGGGGVGAA